MSAGYGKVEAGQRSKCLYCDGEGTRKQETYYGFHTGKIAVCDGCEGTGEQIVQEQRVLALPSE